MKSTPFKFTYGKSINALDIPEKQARIIFGDWIVDGLKETVTSPRVKASVFEIVSVDLKKRTNGNHFK